jgi:hypothetical protein
MTLRMAMMSVYSFSRALSSKTGVPSQRSAPVSALWLIAERFSQRVHEIKANLDVPDSEE